MRTAIHPLASLGFFTCRLAVSWGPAGARLHALVGCWSPIGTFQPGVSAGLLALGGMPGVALGSFVVLWGRGCRRGCWHSAAWPGSVFGVFRSFILLSVFGVQLFFQARPSRRMCQHPRRHPLLRAFGRSSLLQGRVSRRMCQRARRHPLLRAFGRSAVLDRRASSRTRQRAPSRPPGGRVKKSAYARNLTAKLLFVKHLCKSV